MRDSWRGRKELLNISAIKNASLFRYMAKFQYGVTWTERTNFTFVNSLTKDFNLTVGARFLVGANE